MKNKQVQSVEVLGEIISIILCQKLFQDPHKYLNVSSENFLIIDEMRLILSKTVTNPE